LKENSLQLNKEQKDKNYITTEKHEDNKNDEIQKIKTYYKMVEEASKAMNERAIIQEKEEEEMIKQGKYLTYTDFGGFTYSTNINDSILIKKTKK